VQRLLAAFETRSNGATGAGGLTFVAAATGLAQTTTDTTARTMLLATGTRRWTQIIQVHGSTLHTEKVISLVDHAAVFRSIQNFDGMIDATQAETLDAGFMIGQTAIGALDQSHFDGVSHG